MIMKERECKGLRIDNHGLIFFNKILFYLMYIAAWPTSVS